MVSGRMMMIRTCLSLIIATVTKDLVTTQVLRHVVGLCFRPTFLLQTSEKRIFRSLRLAGTAKGFVHRAIVVSARVGLDVVGAIAFLRQLFGVRRMRRLASFRLAVVGNYSSCPSQRMKMSAKSPQ